MGVFSNAARDERFIFVGLGIATIAFIGITRRLLQHYRDEAEVRPTQPKTQYITQETEDSLQLVTLESLVQHHNFAIQDTALKILAGRAIHDKSAVDVMLRGITHKSYEQRSASLRALSFAVDYKESYHEPINALHEPKVYAALVRSLEIGLDDVEQQKLDDVLHDDYCLRDINERRCISLIAQLVYLHGSKELVQAKFIEKWLAKQKWGDSDTERQWNFQQYIKYKKNRIRDICITLRTSKMGRKALHDAQLWVGDPSDPGHCRDVSTSRVKLIIEIALADDYEEDGVDNIEALVPRVTDQSAEEQRRRRRHREAIVLNDGTHSLGRDDIIEREHDTTG